MPGPRAILQSILRRFGYELVRYPIVHFLDRFGIDVVLDVGANTGQYGRELRRLGYRGRIVSFEPLRAAFEELERNAMGDPAWSTVRLAMGSADTEATLHVSGKSASSSLLDMLPRHTEVAPETAYVAEERVDVRCLDHVIDTYCSRSDRVLLKIDTQGFESEVLAGARESLNWIAGVQMELSMVPLYLSEKLVEDLIASVRAHGLVPYWLNHGFKDPSSQQLLQVDGLFFRDASGPNATSQ
jgi:FkbM family methyltransferase